MKSALFGLFIFCIIAWLVVTGITPVGGWNPESSTYNSLYKTMFCYTGSACLIMLVVLFFVSLFSKESN